MHQTDRRRGLGCVAPILIVIVLCLGLPVGLLEVYLWQHCLFAPSGSNVEVVVSACENPRLWGMSPDGRYISYGASTFLSGYRSWLLDTVTGERRLDTCYGDWWLDNTIRLGGGYATQTANYGGFWICDINDRSKVPAQRVDDIPGAITRSADGAETYSPEVVEWFRNADQVYYVSFHRWAVALGPDFKSHPERAYVLASEREYFNPAPKLLEENQIPYHKIGYPNDGSALVSHNERFERPFWGGDRDFHMVDGARIGPVYDFNFGYDDCCRIYGWAYDDSGVYGQGSTVPEGGMFPYPSKAQPIIKLNLPLEYLSPVARQTMESHQNQKKVESAVKIGGVSSLIVISLTLIWLYRKKKITLSAQNKNF